MTVNCRIVAFAAGCVGFFAAAAAAQEVAPPPRPADAPAEKPEKTPPPRVKLRYVELRDRTPFAFAVQGKGEFLKPAGALHFEFPERSFPSDGLDQDFRTFCAEPFVPIAAGQTYPFAVEPFGDPAHFGLPDDEAGQKQAAKRTRLIRELYGRFYQETLSDPALANPAFQAALWELIAEPTFPEDGKAFSLHAGAFRAAHPAAEAPEFVQRAEQYLSELTGDDASFDRNPALLHLELVRLTGLSEEDVAAPESQLALRRRLRTPASGDGSLLSGGGGSMLGRMAGGGGAPAGGGGGGGGGFGGGGPGFPNGPGDLIPPGNGGDNNGSGPLDPTTPTAPEKPPVDPPPVTPPNPVPAPPGAILGLAAAGAFAIRTLAGRRSGK